MFAAVVQRRSGHKFDGDDDDGFCFPRFTKTEPIHWHKGLCRKKKDIVSPSSLQPPSVMERNAKPSTPESHSDNITDHCSERTGAPIHRILAAGLHECTKTCKPQMSQPRLELQTCRREDRSVHLTRDLDLRELLHWLIVRLPWICR